MYRVRRKRGIIIGSLLGLLLLITVGYAAFQTQLEIKGSSKITSNWEIKITNVTNGTPTGSAENAVPPTWTDLTANMEANLYEKGDAMEYDVTISNRGTFDAILKDVVTTNPNNEAVIITFSGYTKGETIPKNTDKIIHVKIEYNPNYNGGQTTATATAEPIIEQGEGSNIDPTPRHLLTYNYTENGGTSSNAQNEYLLEGTIVNLEGKTATKEVNSVTWEFVGWNIDQNEDKGQSTVTIAADTTLYAIFKKDIAVTYKKGENNGVSSIGKTEDSCTLWNKTPSCEKTLPTITLTDSTTTEVLGWYNEDTGEKVGDPGDTYAFTDSVSLVAKTKVLPIMRKWDSNGNYLNTIDFHDSQNRANITTIEFKDSITAPETATKWDVSAAGNGSVIAWLSSDGKTLYIGGDGGVIAPDNMGHAFQDFTALTSINLNHLDVSNTKYMYSTFAGNTSLTTVTFGNNFDTSKVTTMSNMFESCSALTNLDLSNLDTSKVEYFSWMFMDCTNLSSINFTGWDTSSATTMAGMFQNCSSLPSLNISHFDTSRVTTMQNMFAMFNLDGSLTTLNLSNFNTSKVKNMEAMFYGNSSLTSINLSSFNTSNVTNMKRLFHSCSALTSLDLSNFNTSKVTTMEGMFQDIKNITDLNLNNFDTSKVQTMLNMFNGPNSLDSKLARIYICGADTSLVTDMSQMFQDLPSLVTIYASEDFITSSVTSSTDMFYNDTALIGGNGTAFDWAKTEKEYARIDKTGQPGYFTLGNAPLITNVTTQTTSNSATVIVDAYVPSGESITSYEYSIDGGTTWVQTTGGTAPNIHTFTGLTSGTNYNIMLRVTTQNNKVTTETVSTTTKLIELPTFSEGVSGEVVITYPTGCSTPYTCSYTIDDGQEVTVSANTVTLPLGTDGTVEAKVADGTSTVSSIYNLRKTDLYVSVNGSDTTGVGTLAQPYATINKAYSSASSTTDATIYVMNNINQASVINMNASKDITITSSNSNGEIGSGIKNTITRTNTADTSLINSSTGTLKLQNIIIDGNNVQQSTGRLISIRDGEIASGTTLKNAKSGGIIINGGTVNMTGGTIRNNTGHGLEVSSNSTFNMSGGNIDNNTSTVGGGIYSNPNSTITISGGNISGNSATADGGGGIYSNGTLNISGGRIVNNTSGYAGGGIITQSTSTITGGEISNNTSTVGGGIYIAGGGMNISGGTISSNKAANGGGIYLAGSTTLGFNNTSTSKITGNTATTGNGGGIVIEGTVTMNGGEISSNTAPNGAGGGIRINSGGTLGLNGGTIKNNSAKTAGGISKVGNYWPNSSGSQSCSGNNQSNLNAKCILS